MSIVGVEWFAAGFFLIVLIVFRQCEQAIKAESTEGHVRLAGGLAILSLTALSRLYQSIGMFQQAPFLSETVFFDLVYWVLVIVGGAMIVSGAAHWLPLMRRNSQTSEAQIARLDLIRRIEQLTGVENRLDIILSTALQYMQEAFHLGPAIVCKCSSDCRRVRVVSVSQEFTGDKRDIQRTVASRAIAHQVAGKTVDPARLLAECLAEEQGRPEITIPMEVSGRFVGMFAFWNRNGEEINSDVRLIMQLAADIIARKVAIDGLKLRIRSQEQKTSWLEQARAVVENEPGTRLKFTALSRVVSERFAARSISLCVVHAGQRMDRFTWAEGRTLFEYRLPLLSDESLVAVASESGRPLLYGDLSHLPETRREEMLISSSAHSLAVVPFKVTNDVKAVLVLSGDRESAFDEGNLAEIGCLSPLMAALVLPDLLKEARRREGSRLERLNKALRVLDSGESRQSLVSTLASLVREEYDADILRLSLTDESGMFLESRVLVTADSRRCAVPADGRIILSLAPVHEHVLMTGQSTVMNRFGAPAELADFELSQTLTEDVNQTAIVPLIAGGRSIGVLTMGSLHGALVGVDAPGGLALAEIAAAIMSEPLASEKLLPSISLFDPARRNRLVPKVSAGMERQPERQRVHADIFS